LKSIADILCQSIYILSILNGLRKKATVAVAIVAMAVMAAMMPAKIRPTNFFLLPIKPLLP
jgi:hypothetical protein